MKHFNKLSILALFLSCTFNSNAQSLQMLDIENDEAVAVSSEETARVSQDREAASSQILSKNPKTKLSVEQFIEYVKEVEALNPEASPQQIITMLHSKKYAKDEHVPLPLFREGGENKGWKNIKLPNGAEPPKFITDLQGNVVDVAHSYAGVRGGLNRILYNRWAMRNVNTGWGDSAQVVGGYAKGALDYLSGYANGDKNKMRIGRQFMSIASNYKPENQVRGNNLGLSLDRFMLANPNAKLSQAYANCLGRGTSEMDFLDRMVEHGTTIALPQQKLVGAIMSSPTAKRGIIELSKSSSAHDALQRAGNILRNAGSSVLTGNSPFGL